MNEAHTQTEGPWEPVAQPAGAGFASKRPWTVQKPGAWFATNGRVHRYASEARAKLMADVLNAGETKKRDGSAAP